MLHVFDHFFCDKISLLATELALEGTWLVFEVKNVQICAGVQLLELLYFLSVLEQAVCNRLELLNIAFVADDEEKDKLLDATFVLIFALARVVDIVHGVGILAKRLVSFLCRCINIKQLAHPIH